MGKVFFGVPQELALKLRDAFGLDTFVETGTYKAATASWAGTHFKQVYTVEGYLDYFQRSSRAHAAEKNIEFILGDSRVELPRVLAKLDKPALIWLDAHWWGDSMMSAGGPGECPLREELSAIQDSNTKHFILIDDLHCFKGELNKGAVRELWPTVKEVHQRILAAFPDYFVVDYEDVIIGVPPEARPIVEDYMRFPGLRFLVPTSNKYAGLMNPFSYLFNKYISPRLTVDVLRYDVRPPKLPANFQNTSIGDQKNYSWTSGLAAYLKRPDVPRHFIMLLEDYWIGASVDLEKVEALFKYAQAHPEVAKIDLSGDRTKFPHKDYPEIAGIELVEAEQNAAFRASIQAAIWSRDYLREICAKGSWTPWQFEKHGAQNDGSVILGTKEPLIPYVNAVGGEGKNPGAYDHKKIPAEMWDELIGARMVA